MPLLGHTGKRPESTGRTRSSLCLACSSKRGPGGGRIGGGYEVDTSLFFGTTRAKARASLKPDGECCELWSMGLSVCLRLSLCFSVSLSLSVSCLRLFISLSLSMLLSVCLLACVSVSVCIMFFVICLTCFSSHRCLQF